MNQLNSWDVLQEFGFIADGSVMSDIKPGLSFDFGTLRLSASAVLSKRFREVVLLTGILSAPRKIVSIEFEIPRQVPSREFCAALLAWHLDQHCGSAFNPAAAQPWLELGRAHQHLLPWVQHPAQNNAGSSSAAP